MAWIVYYATILLMTAGIRISGLWKAKSRQWTEGRKHWSKKIAHLHAKSGPRIWFHVSSLGEFEQARPVIEKIKSSREEIEIILTFFSPSGYTVRSGYPLATVLYLPADLPGNARKWLDVIQPDMAVFVKYDIWPGYLQALDQKSIPSLLISAHWQPSHRFSSYHLPPAQGLLRRFKKIFLQSDEHLEHYRQEGFTNLDVAGDTRIDRCLNLPGEVHERIPAILSRYQPFELIAGSTWPKDEELLIVAIDRLKLKAIIAPHDVSGDNIRRLMHPLPFPSFRLSEMDEQDVSDFTSGAIIIDNIGMLNVLYALGDIAYVGGGFGSGIHNTLEPMAHSKPVIFGPAFQKFPEATAMVKAGAARSVSNSKDLQDAIEYFKMGVNVEGAGKAALDYLSHHAGATGKVSKYILESIP